MSVDWFGCCWFGCGGCVIFDLVGGKLPCKTGSPSNFDEILWFTVVVVGGLGWGVASLLFPPLELDVDWIINFELLALAFGFEFRFVFGTLTLALVTGRDFLRSGTLSLEIGGNEALLVGGRLWSKGIASIVAIHNIFDIYNTCQILWNQIYFV